MRSLKGYLSEEAGKNTHMTHIEDLVLDGGVKGARQAINALRSLRDMLSGSAKSSTDVTVKWDGAPAVFAGEDPITGEFFVAKKGVFNKNPMVYKSHADIDADTSGDLSKKLKMAFDNLKGVGIKGVIQGDFMYDKSDLGSETIAGVKYTTFHPNTIVYAVPKGSDMEKEISKAEIGIVWHTVYTGPTFDTMRAEFGKSIASKLKPTSKVWSVDATLPDLSGTATMTATQTAAVTAHLSTAGKLFKEISGSILKEIEQNKELNLIINTYNNTKVRANERITNTDAHTKGLIEFVNLRYAKQIDKLKSDKGKERKTGQRDQLLSFFSKNNTKTLKKVFDLQNSVVDAKLIIINKLNSLSNINTFVKTSSGFKVTNPEGFVAIDRMEGGAVKLVDRLEFSTNNFSKDIIKGWDSPSR